MSLPSLPALRAFDAAARCGSFKQAADELGLSPTAISHHIRGLEAQLQIALFARMTRQVALTDAGEALARATASAFAQIEDALEGLQDAERRLTIATTPAFAALWLAPRLDMFEKSHPGFRVRILSSTDRADLRRDRQIDLAIRYGSNAGDGPGSMLLAQESIAAFGAPDTVDCTRDLSKAPLIATKWVSKDLAPITWQDWRAAAGEADAHEVRWREFDQEQEVIQAGLAGKGLILVSTLLVQDMVTRGWLHPYRPDVRLDGYRYSVAVSPHRAEARKVRQFLSWLATVV